MPPLYLLRTSYDGLRWSPGFIVYHDDMIAIVNRLHGLWIRVIPQ